MGTKNRANLTVFLLLVILALPAAASAMQADVLDAEGKVVEIDGYMAQYQPKKALMDIYKGFSSDLKTQDEKLRHCRDKLSAGEQKQANVTRDHDQLAEKIAKLDKKASFWDFKTSLQISAYKKEQTALVSEANVLSRSNQKLREEEARLAAEQEQAKKNLDIVTNQINAKFGGVDQLQRSVDTERTTLDGLKARLEVAENNMTPEEHAEYNAWLQTYDRAKKPDKKNKPELSENQPDNAKADEGFRDPDDQDDQDPGRKPTAEEIARAKELVKTLTPFGPDNPDPAAGDQIIGFNCGTELFSYNQGRQLGKRLRREDLASVTIMRDGKQVDISGPEATGILIKNGFLIRTKADGIVATQKYIDYTKESPDSEVETADTQNSDVPAWRKRGRSYPMSQQDVQTYLGGMKAGASSEKPSWRDGMQTTPMSKEDAATYLGGSKAGASSREHDTQMSEHDANVYGGN